MAKVGANTKAPKKNIPNSGAYKKRSPEETIAAHAAPAKCTMLRCSNIVAACCNGKCWTCSALEYERNR